MVNVLPIDVADNCPKSSQNINSSRLNEFTFSIKPVTYKIPGLIKNPINHQKN